jgi:hypothetical protein
MRSIEHLISAFVAATRSGDLHPLTQLLASDARIATDGGGLEDFIQPR